MYILVLVFVFFFGNIEFRVFGRSGFFYFIIIVCCGVFGFRVFFFLVVILLFLGFIWKGLWYVLGGCLGMLGLFLGEG